jgi:hypothetical protein
MQASRQRCILRYAVKALLGCGCDASAMQLHLQLDVLQTGRTLPAGRKARSCGQQLVVGSHLPFVIY